MNKRLHLKGERPKNRAKEMKNTLLISNEFKFLRRFRYYLCILIITSSFFSFYINNIFSRLLININLFYFGLLCWSFFFVFVLCFVLLYTKLAKTQLWSQRSNLMSVSIFKLGVNIYQRIKKASLSERNIQNNLSCKTNKQKTLSPCLL